MQNLFLEKKVLKKIILVFSKVFPLLIKWLSCVCVCVCVVSSARQEKWIDYRVTLYQIFIDLTKAFYTVNRTALWTILGKHVYPTPFVNILHRDIKARTTFNGLFS